MKKGEKEKEHCSLLTGTAKEKKEEEDITSSRLW